MRVIEFLVRDSLLNRLYRLSHCGATFFVIMSCGDVCDESYKAVKIVLQFIYTVVFVVGEEYFCQRNEDVKIDEINIYKL